MIKQVIVGEVKAGESKKVRKQLEGLISSLNRSTFDVGELLHTIRKNGFYKDYGYNTMKEYVSELDIKLRKSQYLERIFAIMDEIEIPRAEFEPIGIAKLREITSLNVRNEDGTPAIYRAEDGTESKMSDVVRGLTVQAPQMELKELQQAVRGLKGLVGEADLTWLNISVNRQALTETIEPAFELARKQLGSAGKDSEGIAVDYSDGKALEMVCVEFLNDPANQILAGEV
jgi:hypothetical protein